MRRATPASFLGDERGHGLAEYCLIAAFISLVVLALYIKVSGGVQDLWTTANSALVTGNSSTANSGGSSTGATTH
jgi:Flp pilus assembly pilin Flp